MINANWSDHKFIYGQPPRFAAALIALLTLGIVAALVWMSVGEIDDVVRVSGVLRPTSGISTVRNSVGGQVYAVHFTDGQQVEAGTLLFVIDANVITEQLKAAQSELEYLQRHVTILMTVQDSIRTQQFSILTAEDSATYHLQVFITKYQQLLLTYNNVTDKLAIEKRINALPVHELEQLAHQQAAAKLALDSYVHETLLSLEQQIEETRHRLRAVESHIKELQLTKELCYVRAPIAGTVQVTQVINAGEYLPAGVEVLRLIPTEQAEYQVELSVANQDIALIKAGQTVMHRFSALPYKEFGAVPGEVITIGQDAMVAPDGTLIYRVTSSITSAQIQDRYGNTALLKPGMLCEARIVVRREKILYHLLRKIDLIN